jgi:hypothetical protein
MSDQNAVRRDWMVELVGLKLVTHHPVIEPNQSPPPSRERKFAMQIDGVTYAVSLMLFSLIVRPVFWV